MTHEVAKYASTLPVGACFVVRWDNDRFWAVWQIVTPAEDSCPATLRCRANHLDGWFDYLQDPQETNWLPSAWVDRRFSTDADALEMQITLVGDLLCPHP